MDRVFEALASTPRRQILAYLNAGELTAGEIGARFDFSKPALSGHLRVLEQAGLIEREDGWLADALMRDRPAAALVAAEVAGFDALSDMPKAVTVFGSARLAEGTVVAAEMGTVGARIGGQLPVVVDDQRHTRRPAQRQQRVHLCAALRGIGALVAVLQPRRLRQHRRDACQQACGVDLVGREQIQAAWRGGTGIHRRGFRWRERDGTMRHHLHAARPIIR